LVAYTVVLTGERDFLQQDCKDKEGALKKAEASAKAARAADGSGGGAAVGGAGDAATGGGGTATKEATGPAGMAFSQVRSFLHLHLLFLFLMICLELPLLVCSVRCYSECSLLRLVHDCSQVYSNHCFYSRLWLLLSWPSLLAASSRKWLFALKSLGLARWQMRAFSSRLSLHTRLMASRSI